jgi:PKD repeat protein
MGGLTHANYLQAAIQYAYQAGIPVVAAMMNDGDATVYYPAAYPETIAVGATDRFDHRAYFSNYSAHIDLIAPGQSIYSSLWNNTYISWSGTSMAAPHVAGALGLLQALEPGLSVETQRSRLYAASDDQVGQAWEDTPGWDIYSGAGRLNLDRLLRSSHARLSGLNLTRPPDGLPGVTYTFTASVEPPNAMQPVTYTWNADGQTPLVHTGGLSDTAAFAWPASGSQTITVTAQNPLNGIEIIFEFLVRVPVTPTAAFTALPSQGIAPLAVTFENTSVGDYLSSAWDFGDGAASSRQHPGHVYLLPGSYTVTLSVSAAWGSDSLAIPAFIQVFPGESVYLPLLWR